MACVIFDLDGTLIHSAPDIHAAVNRMLADEGADALTLAQVQSFIGNGVPTLIARVMAARGEPDNPARHAALEARFMAHYSAAPDVLTRLYPGVPDALHALVAAGYTLGLCTNKPEAPARTLLQSFGLSSFFGVVVGGDSLPQRKPHPEPLLACMQALGGPAVYVGDSEVDAETALAANVPMLLFTEGYRKSPISSLPHAASFSQFAALPRLVAALV